MAAGARKPADLDPSQFLFRRKDGEVLVGHQMYPRLGDGELLAGMGNAAMVDYWRRARADSFARVGTPTQATASSS